MERAKEGALGRKSPPAGFLLIGYFFFLLTPYHLQLFFPSPTFCVFFVFWGVFFFFLTIHSLAAFSPSFLCFFFVFFSFFHSSLSFFLSARAGHGVTYRIELFFFYYNILLHKAMKSSGRLGFDETPSRYASLLLIHAHTHTHYIVKHAAVSHGKLLHTLRILTHF